MLQAASDPTQQGLLQPASDLEQQHQNEQHIQHLQHQVSQLKSDLQHSKAADKDSRQGQYLQQQQKVAVQTEDRQPLLEQQHNNSGAVSAENSAAQSQGSDSRAGSRRGQGAGPYQDTARPAQHGAGPDEHKAGPDEHRAGPDENEAPQSLLVGNPALVQWEEKKKMQKRIETLKSKLRVSV